MEYAHRMWGRLTGLVIMVPAAYFWVRGRLGPALKPRVGVYIGLVVAQVMVKTNIIYSPSALLISLQLMLPQIRILS